jgi:hypothetical protein
MDPAPVAGRGDPVDRGDLLMNARSLAPALLALTATGCAFDLSRLMPPPRDGDAPMDVSATDAAMDGPAADASPGPACVSLLDMANARDLGGSLVLSGTTRFSSHVLNPPSTCNATSNGAPEVYYDYQMRRGGRLVAATEVPTEGTGCPLRFDTVVSIFAGTCEMRGEALGCNDDVTFPDQVSCFTSGSRAVAPNVAINDRVTVVVDGYESNSGDFTLTLCENPLEEVPPPALPTSEACQCPAGGIADATAEPIQLVSSPPDPGAAAGGRLETVGQYLGGPRTLIGNTIKGIAGVIGVQTNDFNTRAACRDARMIVDLVFGGRPLRSFVLDASVEAAKTPRIMFRTAPDARFASPSTVLLRVRENTGPAGMGCGVTITTGTITVLSARSTVPPDAGASRG